MQPYYEKDGITLYHADAREVLPYMVERVDLLLTDPPYGVDGSKGGGNRARAKSAYDADFPDTPEYVDEVVIPIVESALTICERGIITVGTPHNIRVYPEPEDIGAFFTPASKGHGKWGHVTFMPILYYGKDPRAGRNWPSGKSLTEHPLTKEHPCAKPLNAWQWLMAKGSLDGETVLDPFCGAGTTLRAAKNLGRRAIGIEIEERYCDLAARMLSQEVMAVAV